MLGLLRALNRRRKRTPRRFCRNRPDEASIIIATLPRSGTNYIAGTLKSSLWHYDHNRTVAGGKFPRTVVRPDMAADAAKGRLCSVAHLSGSAGNVAALHESGVQKIVLHVRDPRASTYSWSHHARLKRRLDKDYEIPVEEFFALPEGEQIDRHISVFLPKCIEWLEAWTSALESERRPEILVTSYEQLASQPHDLFSSILSFFGIPEQRIVLREKSPSLFFRSGDPDEWRRALTPEQIARMNTIVPQHLIEKFGWRL